jgi:thiol-disulfide isomerase/thioredoxin
MIFFCPMLSKGQKVKALTVGDKVPDIAITHVYNSSSSRIHLPDLRGKLVILDFMATSCVPCVKVLPRFDSLQRKFRKSIQIILISPEDSARLKVFLNNHQALLLPIALDTNAAKFFPHAYISHVVWVDTNGLVCAITHPERVNAEDIQSILDGEKVNWPVKRDIPDYDFSQPLFHLNETKLPSEAQPVNCYYSSIINYLPGVPKHSKISEDEIHHSTHFSFINYSRFELYKILFNCFQIPLTHVLIQGDIRRKLFYERASGYYESWKRENVYCLEATLPSGSKLRQQKNKLLEDIGYYFNMSAVMEKRSVECLVLKNTALSVVNPSVKQGLTLGSVVGTLNHHLNEPPVIDETRGKDDLVLPFTEEQVANNSYLSTTLAKYGIEVRYERREIEFLVIKQSGDTAYSFLIPKK